MTGVCKEMRFVKSQRWLIFNERVKSGEALLCVKSRLVINALLEQFRFFGVPVLQRLNG
jgi:hypothetical protein